MDELLQRAAENMGMPPSLAERSAQAKAEKTGTTVESVLREWAGEDAGSDSDAAAPEEAAATAEAVEESPAEAATGPTEVTVDYLVALAADAKRMPPKLVLSSAEARAKNSNSDVESVLAAWAGADLDELKAQAAEGTAPAVEMSEAGSPAPEAEEPEPKTEPAVAEPAPAAAVASAGAMSMDELLEKVSEAKGMPVPLAKRSAEARAKKTGEPLEAVLAEWAGIDPSTVSAAAAPEAAQPTATPAAESEVEDTAADGSGDVEIIEAEAPAIDDVVEDEDDGPTVRGGYPSWLAAAFVIIPMLAVVYILASPNGPDCGVAGQLNIDDATGLAVNCDGSDYGSSEIDFFARGGAIYAQCAACHGTNGEGGAGPAMQAGAVLATFPSGMCSDQIEWVKLGTANFPEPTYGATNRPVGGGGVMPGYEGQLSDEEIASVVLYERVQFGGQPLEEAQLDCGLGPEEGTEEAAAEG